MLKAGVAQKSPEGSRTPSSPNDGKVFYEEFVIGVWRVLLVKDSPFSSISFQWESLSATFALLYRAFYDVYSISPRLFALSIITHIWLAIEGPLLLYFSNRLFFFIDKRISGGFDDDKPPIDLYLALIFRVACSLLSTYMSWWSQKIGYAYSSRIKYEYQARIFSADLGCDLQTAQEQGASKPDVDDIYMCLDRGIMIVNEVFSLILHLGLILQVIGSALVDVGPALLAICIPPALLGQFLSGDLWMKAYVVSPANKFYIRKLALEKLAEADLRQEVIAGGINTYLIDEYRKAKDGLGDTPDTRVESLHADERQTLSDILMRLCSDGPTLFFALLALISPSKLSVIQLAVLNEMSMSMRYAFLSIKMSLSVWPGLFHRMMNVYAALETKNKMKDGQTPFPRLGYEASVGMGIQVQNVSFSYPNAKSERAALTNVSFAIQPGQLVVIVGANGSGKSTIIKLLSRFYNPTSGRILIDGTPIEEYRIDELRRGIAILTQEHQLFPLSVRENIQLGSSDVEVMKDEKKIRASASAAGAEDFLKNFSDGYETVLEPVTSGYLSYMARGNKDLELMKEKLEKPTKVSGGEKQKLVAARTFMRLYTSPVKLVTVDEPSSALDPEAEYRLFTNLRKERNGRTMIFVTHRFGHLTKHADLIICIKEGVVVETGTHADLLSRDGEYAHLYNVQAQAFATT